ncbi:MAG: YlmC/YmxH family sporulation protein [Firmicutes bacterium]|nr:YlmC/YmxH family sporulation protein [Bacillota bacterium]
MELSFCDLRCKEVVNLVDGRCLGHVIDLVFEQCCGKVLGIVVPGLKRGSFFRVREDIFIPYHQVCKIGADMILVELNPIAGAPCHGPAGRGVHICGLPEKREHGKDRKDTIYAE